MSITVRNLGFHDLGEAADLLHRVFDGYDPGSTLAMLAALTSTGPLKLLQHIPSFEFVTEVRKGYHFHAAFEGEKLAGVIGVYEMPETRYKHGSKLRDSDIGSGQNIWIEWFAVEKDMRGKGVGTILLKSFVDDALSHAMAKGYESPNICLINENADVPKNESAKKFYSSLGIEPVVMLGGKNQSVVRSVKLSDLVETLEEKGVDFKFNETQINYLNKISLQKELS